MVWEPPGDWRAGLGDTRAERLARAFPGGERGAGRAHAERLALVREFVPEGAPLYVLVEPLGAPGFVDLLASARMERLLWPRFVQGVDALPLPDAARRPAGTHGPAWVLDLRREPNAPPPGFALAAERAGARLWNEAP